MKTLLLFTITLFFGFLSYAQEGSKAVLDGTIIYAEKNGISEVLIVLKLKNKEISRLITPSSGKFEKLNIPIGDVYTVIISKKGYITKTIQLDLRYDSTECHDLIGEGTIFPIEISTELDVFKKDKKYPKELKNFINASFSIDNNCLVRFDSKFIEDQRNKYNSWVK